MDVSACAVHAITPHVNRSHPGYWLGRLVGWVIVSVAGLPTTVKRMVVGHSP